MPNIAEHLDRGTGDQRPPELLPGYDDDWRDPRNAQLYAVPGLELDDLLNLQKYPDLNVQEYVDRLRLLQSREVAAAFALMMGLADDRLVSLADDLALCDAETPVARAYQAARKVLIAYCIEKRLRVGPTYLVAARIVAQCIDVEFLTHDLPQKKRELSALAKGRLTRLSPGTFYIVPEILAGRSGLDTVANFFNRDRSTVSESTENAISNLQRTFGRYCNGLAIPPEKRFQRWYSRCEKDGAERSYFFWAPEPRSRPVCFVEGRNRRADRPQPALAPTTKLPDETFLGAWRAEALEYWGYWGDATKLPQGLAEGYLQPGIPAAYSGARDYDSDPMLIWHPQPAADWQQIVNDALPNSKLKTRLADQNAAIEDLVSDEKHKSASNDYFSGGHHWPSKAVARRLKTRGPYYGPVHEVNGRLCRRPYFRTAERDAVPDVVDHLGDDAMTREDRFYFAES